MKKLMLLPIVILLIASCELLKDITEVDFGSDFKKSFPVDLGLNDSSIDEFEVIKITDDDEVEKYKENLEDIKVDSVVLGIEGYNGPEEVFINGTLEYSDTISETGIIFAEISDLNITELYKTGKTHKVKYKESEIDKAADIMKQDLAIKVYLKGTASNTPVNFKLVVMFYTTVTAQALD